MGGPSKGDLTLRTSGSRTLYTAAGSTDGNGAGFEIRCDVKACTMCSWSVGVSYRAKLDPVHGDSDPDLRVEGSNMQMTTRGSETPWRVVRRTIPEYLLVQRSQ